MGGACITVSTAGFYEVGVKPCSGLLSDSAWAARTVHDASFFPFCCRVPAARVISPVPQCRQRLAEHGINGGILAAERQQTLDAVATLSLLMLAAVGSAAFPLEDAAVTPYSKHFSDPQEDKSIRTGDTTVYTISPVPQLVPFAPIFPNHLSVTRNLLTYPCSPLGHARLEQPSDGEQSHPRQPPASFPAAARERRQASVMAATPRPTRYLSGLLVPSVSAGQQSGSPGPSQSTHPRTT